MISVIIAVFNKEKLIQECLRSVLNQNIKMDYEVIVVDDASTDNTSQILKDYKDPKLSIIYNDKNHGAAFSRNRGIQKSSGEYIVFLDSDCVAQSDWLEAIIKPFDSNSSIMIISGKTIDPPSRNYWEMVNEGLNYISFNDGYVNECHSCNMAVRASFMRENLFNESLPFSEDLDLCLRCLRKESLIYYTSKALLIHFHRSDFASTIRSYFCWATYNVFVRLYWKAFPFLNYGTFFILGILFLLCFGFKNIAEIIFIIYLILLFCAGIRPGGKSFSRLLMSYPSAILISLTNCIGNIYGLILFLGWKFKNVKG